jgi:hypothetical protein
MSVAAGDACSCHGLKQVLLFLCEGTNVMHKKKEAEAVFRYITKPDGTIEKKLTKRPAVTVRRVAPALLLLLTSSEHQRRINSQKPAEIGKI